MARGIITRLLFWLLVVNFSWQNITKGTITCNVTVAHTADWKQRWNVSCFFPQDLSQTGESFAVFQHSLKDTASTMYACNILNQRPVCEGREGFEPPQTASSEVSMIVPKDGNSYFKCNTIPSKGVQTEPCSFSSNDATVELTQPVTLKTDTTTDHDGDVQGNAGQRLREIGLYVLGAFSCGLLLALLVVALVYIRRRLANRSLHQRISTPDGKAYFNKASMRSETGSEGEGHTLLAVGKAEKPEWCSCGHCLQMPTELERICCTCTPCLSTSQKFLDILDEAKAWEPKKEELLHGNLKETRRWRCYYKFVEWRHGRLGKGQKCPVYSCCVWAVRNTFPEEDGQYTGFVEGSMVVHSTEDWNQKYENGEVSRV